MLPDFLDGPHRPRRRPRTPRATVMLLVAIGGVVLAAVASLL